MKTILLKFAGPLQSWGTGSHFETRHTDYYPSKSAVIGLIAGSMGIRREEEERLEELRNLDFALRIDQQGQILRDYHIASKYKPTGVFEKNYVTNRYYLEDAIFMVAIGSEEEEKIEEIAEALKSPYFQGFMGRRSLPLTADFFYGIEEKNPIEALKEIPWQGADWYKKHHKNQLTIYADAHLIPEEKGKPRKDRPISFHQKERKFAFRMEAKTSCEVPGDLEAKEHDAFGAIGG
ncbi:type I-E CRISPR-associated protein Cas5/CasD [Peptoniphilus sp. KCTC 25270]|uniref:type I-E CRISPR-associated protein Cas5/CasD n=1 Tax=Peptoniphilus sp. KCTC 25270 TaxID=2897414 RepID=UPI001E45D680|nr:type I-E CRISPR-associated protein Cas5/CasD [Peptoniphilus sp. KCTC 25270]MCD1147299.1 type I-E CRISPR-associated protein Cas5/CasD [Peptoniphilus sp. KCTC 25270]